MNRNSNFFSKIFMALAMGLLLVPGPVGAEPVPEENLIVDFANCMSGCRDFEGEIGCQVLCGCTMERFKAVLDREKYLALSKEIEEEAVSPENRVFLDETALLCVAEMDQALEDMGLTMPGEAGPLPPPEEEDGGSR